MPTWQGFASGHATFAVHPTHVPPPQTLLVPHVVPFAAAVPVSVHAATPPVHELTVPKWQRFATGHPALTLHALQTPP
jgi:hypothetical protein